MDEETESWQELTTENQKKKEEKKEKSMSRWSSLWHEEGEGKTLQEIRVLHHRTMFSPLPHPSDASSQARSTEGAFWGRADRLRYEESIAVEIQWPPFPKSCRCVWKARAHLHAGLVEVHVVQLLLAAHQLHLQPLHTVRLLPQRVQLISIGASRAGVSRQLDVLEGGERQGNPA